MTPAQTPEAGDRVLGIDVGGSGIKGGIVDLSRGELVTDRHRIKTPQPATPKAVAKVARQLSDHFAWDGRVGVAIPTIVRRGVVHSAANIDPSWMGVDAVKRFTKVLERPVWVLNDADAAGLAELHFGHAKDYADGVVILLTFGTGIGSAVFHDGILLPNSELGHLEFKNMVAEHYAAARLVERDNMEIGPWADRVGEFLRHLERVLTPDLLIFGGGISKRFDDFVDHFDLKTPVRVAQLRNNAGIVGAALASRGLTAAERADDEEQP